MKAIVIDDEPIALEVIKSMAPKVAFIDVKAYFTNALKAMEYLHQNEIDIIFIDIQMPDINGIEFVQSLSRKPIIIFTTAYSEYALQGYEEDAIDYLLKPFAFSRFLKACNKANDLFTLKNKPVEKEQTSKNIIVKSGYEQVIVSYDDIVYIESKGNYLTLNCKANIVTTRMTLSDFEAEMPHDKFIRIHKSFIVAKSEICKWDRSSVYTQKHTLPLGPNYIEIVNTMQV